MISCKTSAHVFRPFWICKRVILQNVQKQTVNPFSFVCLFICFIYSLAWDTISVDNTNYVLPWSPGINNLLKDAVRTIRVKRRDRGFLEQNQVYHIRFQRNSKNIVSKCQWPGNTNYQVCYNAECIQKKKLTVIF